jgi:hypothetical protein
MMAPCGKPMKAIRFGAEPTGVCAHAVAAGFIASISGNAIVAPTPFSTARREMCLRNNMLWLLAKWKSEKWKSGKVTSKCAELLETYFSTFSTFQFSTCSTISSPSSGFRSPPAARAAS